MLKIDALALRNFRCFDHYQTTFDPGVNLFEGPNGSGKTSILEALSLIATGRSFRTRNLRDCVYSHASFFEIEIDFFKENVKQKSILRFDDQGCQVKINATSFNSLSQLIGLIPLVVFTPGDIEIVIGAPDDRRRFFDLQISQASNLYLGECVRYAKALKQKNTLLRLRQLDLIVHWEKQMAKSACIIARMRHQFALEIDDSLQKRKQIHPTIPSFSFSYPFDEKTYLSEETFLRSCLDQREKELERGYSLVGPHRGDYSIAIEKTPLKLFGSEGQKRLFLAHLKLALWSWISQKTDLIPLFAIDDFGVHLDQTRKEITAEDLKMLGQTLITMPEAKHFPLSSPAKQTSLVEKIFA